MGAWVFGFGRHSNPLEVFPVKEKTKIQHHTMFTASSTCRASFPAAAVFPALLVSFLLLCLERGGTLRPHVDTFFPGRKDSGSHDVCLSCPCESEGQAGSFSLGSFSTLLLAPKATMTDSLERSLQTDHRTKPQRTLGSQWESPRGRHSVGDKTLVTRAVPRVSRPPTLARIQADGSNFPNKQHRSAGEAGQERGKGMGCGGGRSGPTSPSHLLFKGLLQCWETGPAIPRETRPESFPL